MARSRPRAQIEAPNTPTGDSLSSRPSSAQSSVASGRRARKASAARSTVRPANSPERSLPPIRSDSSRTTTSVGRGRRHPGRRPHQLPGRGQTGDTGPHHHDGRSSRAHAGATGPPGLPGLPGSARSARSARPAPSPGPLRSPGPPGPTPSVPPAMSLDSGSRSRAAATAARTVAWHKGGESGLLSPRSMYGNWYRRVETSRSARSFASASMKGCSIPAPAPCASTTHSREPRGCRSNPETCVASLTVRVRRFGAEAGIRWLTDSRPINSEEQSQWIILERFESKTAVELGSPLVQRIDGESNAGGLRDRRSSACDRVKQQESTESPPLRATIHR